MLTDKGYRRRTYDEILSEKILKAKELFGEDIDTSDLTPLGKYIRINAYDQSLVEEDAENIYYSIFPNTATGQSLDRLCVFVGISRNPATAAEYNISITGTAGYIVPVGFEVGTESEITYYTVSEQEIGEDGTAEVTVACTQTGEIGNVLPAEINRIINPDAEIDSIIGVEQTVAGSEVESDYALRKRFEGARTVGGSSEAAIIAAVLRVPTVTSAGIVVNKTNAEVDGRPPHSFECFVGGGENYQHQIAQAIFESSPAGITMCGSITQYVTDDSGETYEIKFSKTADIMVYVRFAAETNNLFIEESGKEEIKISLQNYIDNIGVGEILATTALYGKIYSVSGITNVTSLEVSTDGVTWGTDDITAEKYEKCKFVQAQVKFSSEYEVI